jgi:hypothetical protein
MEQQRKASLISDDMGHADLSLSPRLSGAKPAVEARNTPRALSVRVILLFVTLLVAGAWVVSRGSYFTPGSDLGYNLGLAGSLMMLALLLYPLRKHWSWLARLGSLRRWFWLHMFLGIAGPTLILVHSTFTVGSLNAAVALYSMLCVAGSGIIGRFMYTKIHHGLYGRTATLQERQVRLGLTSGEMKTALHFAPAVESRLRAIEAYAAGRAASFVHELARFLTIGLRARWIYLRSGPELNRGLRARARTRGWEPEKLARRRKSARRLLRAYLAAVQEVAQFTTYERLFSAWHILHVPFVYLMVISAIVHVIAVHMY